MKSNSGTFYGEATVPDDIDVESREGLFGRTMDRVHDAIEWYQKKIGSYDKQLWEQSVEKKLQKSHFLHNAPRKSVRLKTEYIDVDLIRGSTFAKTKPQVPWVYVTRRAAARILFYPFYYTWWVHQTSVKMYFLLLVLYVMQVATTIVYIRNFDHSILEDEMSFTEVILPAILMFLLCIIHSQTVLAHITHKPPKRSKEISRVVRKPKLKKPSRRGHRSSGNNSSACPDDSGADGGTRPRAPVPPTRHQTPVPSSQSVSEALLNVTATSLSSRISVNKYTDKPTSSLTLQIDKVTAPSSVCKVANHYHKSNVNSKKLVDNCACYEKRQSLADTDNCVNKGELHNGVNSDVFVENSQCNTDISNGVGNLEGKPGKFFVDTVPKNSIQSSGKENIPNVVDSVNHVKTVNNLDKSDSSKNIKHFNTDSGCDAVSIDSTDPPGEEQKIGRGYSVDSISGNSDFEFLDNQNRGEEKLKRASIIASSDLSTASTSENSKFVDSSHSSLNQCNKEYNPSSCHSVNAEPNQISKSQSLQDQSISSPKITAISMASSSSDSYSVPKIIIQQPSVTKILPFCLPNHTTTMSTAKSDCTGPQLSSSVHNHLQQNQQQRSTDTAFTESSQPSAIDPAQVVDPPHTGSSQLQFFSEMFVQKILDDEGDQEASGSYLLATSDLENSSSSLSHISSSSDQTHTVQSHTDKVRDVLSSPSTSPLPLDESLDHPSDGERPSDVSNYNPSDSESDDMRKRCEDRGKRLRFHETVISGPTGTCKVSSKPPTGPSHSILTRKTSPLNLNTHTRKSSGNIAIIHSSGSDQDHTDSRSSLRRRRRTSGTSEASEIKTAVRSRPSSLGLRAHNVTRKNPSSSENETGGAVETPEGSTKAAMSSEEWEDRIQTDETTSSAYTSSCGEGESDEDEDKSEYTTSTLHVINLLHPQSGSTNSAGGTVSQPDKVSCVIWEGNELKKVDLTALDIGWAIIDKVDSLPESSDYFLIGLLFSAILAVMPLIYRGFGSKEQINWEEMMTLIVSLPGSLPGLAAKLSSYAGIYSWRQHVVMMNGILQRLVLSLIFFFLLSVADRTFKQRLLYAKHFSYLTSSRRARKFSMPHFRLNKVRNIKIWLSLRSYLKRRGPQRSVDVIVSACFMSAVCVVCLISIQMLKDTEIFLDYLCNWELLVWCFALGVFLMRFMTLGLKINKKYRNLSVLITEQINLYLQMEQKPHKKEELILANNVLRLAEDLLKELESPFKISGFSANPLIYNIMRVVVLSAFSAVLTEVLGFKLKLYKIKLKG